MDGIHDLGRPQRTAVPPPVGAVPAASRLAEPGGLVKPRLRGVSHLYAFGTSLMAGAALVVVAPAGRARVATAVYALGLTGMLGASALLHRGNWSPNRYLRLLKLDHSMIFVMIAGTYTPLAVLAIGGTVGAIVLVVAWTGAAFGIAFEWAARRLPRGWSLTLYITLGWLAVLAMPWLWRSLGVGGFALLITGGLLYTLGAIAHAARWPDPNPLVFGYHEVFHVLVLAAVTCHYVCIARYALPPG